MKFLWRYVLVVAALMAGSLLLAGCGGGGEELALDEYFRQLGEIEEAADARAEMLEQESQGAGEDLQASRDYVDGLQVNGEQTINDLEGLHPPGEARDAHDEFVAALREFVPLWEDLSDRLADLESLSEFDALIAEVAPPFEEATERLDEACFELQGIADENGIAVDLGCEE